MVALHSWLWKFVWSDHSLETLKVWTQNCILAHDQYSLQTLIPLKIIYTFYMWKWWFCFSYLLWKLYIYMITYSFLLSLILLFNLSLYASRLVCCNFKIKLFNKNFSCWNCREVYFAHIIVLLEQRLVLSCLWLFWKISSLLFKPCLLLTDFI